MKKLEYNPFIWGTLYGHFHKTHFIMPFKASSLWDNAVQESERLNIKRQAYSQFPQRAELFVPLFFYSVGHPLLPTK